MSSSVKEGSNMETSDPKYRKANTREKQRHFQYDGKEVTAMCVAGLESQFRLELVRDFWKRVLQGNETGISFPTQPTVF